MNLDIFRSRVLLVLATLITILTVSTIAVELVRFGGFGPGTILAVGLSTLMAAGFVVFRLRPTGRHLIVAVLMGQVAASLIAMRGHPMQVDMHMAFFAALAISTAWCCWRSVLVATGVVALHHLLLNFVYPLAVFPDGGEFARVVVHAVILLAEAGALIWLAQRLESALAGADIATDTAIANQQREGAVRQEAALAEERRAEVEEQVLLGGADAVFAGDGAAQLDAGGEQVLEEQLQLVGVALEHAEVHVAVAGVAAADHP